MSINLGATVETTFTTSPAETGTLLVTAPDGTTSTPTVTGPAGAQTALFEATTAGTWTARWDSPNAGQHVETFLVGPSSTGPAWSPTPQDVADLIPDRVLARGGQQQGTFTAETVPTSGQVERVCDSVAREVTRQTGALPAQLQQDGTDIAALGAAARVVLTYFGGAADRDLYDNLAALYTAGLDSLITAAALARGEQPPADGDGDVVAPPRSPAGSFPPADSALARLDATCVLGNRASDGPLERAAW